MKEISADSILEALPIFYYAIDINTRQIIQTNDPEVKIRESKCFEYLFGNESKCEGVHPDCLCVREHIGDSPVVLSETKGSEKKFLNLRFSKLNDDIVLVFAEDVSKEHLFKKELKINAKRLERAEKLADFGSWEVNIDSHDLLASKGASKIYGFDFTGKKLEDAQRFVLSKYRKMLDEQLYNLIHKKESYNTKFKIRRASDGEIRHIHSLAEYREDKRMVFGVIHDMTDFETTQKALLDSEKNLKLLFRHMNSAFSFQKIILDDDGNPVDYVFLDANQKFEETTGLKLEDVENRRVLEVFPNTNKDWIEKYGNVALTGEPVTFSGYDVDLDKYLEVSAYSPKKNYFAVTFSDITKRVHSEIALKESYEDLTLAQKIASLGNWNYDPETKISVWSEQMYLIFERTTDEKPFHFFEYKTVFQQQDFNLFANSFIDAVRYGKSFDIQLKVNLKTNQKKWVRCICQPTLKNGAGKYLLRGTVQDVTATKEAEERLNYSNKLLSTVINSIPDAIYMKDSEYRKIVANKSDLINCGVQNESEVIGKTDFEVFPQKAAASFRADDERVIENGETILNREEILPTKDNKGRVLLTSKFPLKNEADEIVGLVGIGRDVTALKEKESQLKLLEHTVEQTPLSVVITDVLGNIEYVNPAFVDVTGYEFSDVVGENPRILSAGNSKKEFYKNLWKTIKSGENWHGEFFNRKKDGTFHWENAVIAPILDERNEIRHFVAIKEDITEKKKIYEDLKIAKEKAEESDRLKSIFLTNLSHEIRTPLNGILGFSSIICSGGVAPERLSYFGDIVEASGRRLMKVIDDIIEMSMIQSNKLDVVTTEFNLNELLEEQYDFYKDLYLHKRGNLQFKFVPCANQCAKILSDRDKLLHVLKNIIDNAFKFTEHGLISFGYFNSDDKHVILFVKDTGVGIEKDKADLVFEPFRQGEEGDSRKYEGSGLGLTISKLLMNKLNGEILLESEKGKGSVFYLKIPKN